MMQRYRRQTNIPMETLRTVVAVGEAGSLAKAAPLLGLSQPALSAQLKKIESLVGGSIFRKEASGSVVTELGKLVVVHARRIMDSNDQLLRLRGDGEIGRSIRLGITNVYAETLFDKKSELDFARLAIIADHSAALLTSLLEGFTDVALVTVPDETRLDMTLRKINEREVPLSWVRSSGFVLSPGAPIPLLTWPGQNTDDIMTRALDEAGMTYRIAFSSPDHHATLAAARAGTGLMVLPWDIPLPGLIQAREYYLPPLKSVKLLLCERGDAAARHPALLKFLSKLFFESSANKQATSKTDEAA
jgi:DNA-binding transcriptional LysR family regulator